MFAREHMVASEGQRVDAHSDETADAGSQQRVIRARNKRTGLILATIALAFFIGVILKHTLFR